MTDLFENFKNEIERLEKKPSSNPYDYSEYSDTKTKRVLRDIDVNRNHSWIVEIWNRNKKNLDDTAMIYRGQKFSYKDFFTESYRYAKAMKANGLKKGEEFVCAIENTPEFPFIMGAASILGAKVNLVSSEFDKDYLIDILNNATSSLVFVSDMSLAKMAPVLNKTNPVKKVIPIPIDYSLKYGNQYKNITEQFYKLDVEDYNKKLGEISSKMSIDDFLTSGEKYNDKVVETCSLNDDFTTTYTSGSTGWGKPKGLIHKTRSYISMGRYQDPDTSGIPTIKNRVIMAMVKTMSDTDFMVNVSDTLMQGGVVALEPINDKEYFLTSMIINKPNCVFASRSYWLYAMKQQVMNDIYKETKLKELFVPISVGEPVSANEEKALNNWLRKIKAGINVTKIPIACMCVGGGDSEHGGIFISIYRSLQSKKPSHIGISEPIGMKTYGMVQMKVLRSNGTYCDTMEYGRLVCNSPTTMDGYVNNKQANENFFIKDAYGKSWSDLGTYGYIDKFGHIYVKNRISKDSDCMLNCLISEIILKDTKNIMSCEVVNVFENGQMCYVAHVEPQLNSHIDEKKLLLSIFQRCNKMLKTDIIDKLFIRIRSNEESFDLLHTGKRNCIALTQEGITDKCYNITDIQNQKSKEKKLIKK